ncbi:MAG: GerMN domain-containing protein [Hyphomicrobiales bacterium]
MSDDRDEMDERSEGERPDEARPPGERPDESRDPDEPREPDAIRGAFDAGVQTVSKNRRWIVMIVVGVVVLTAGAWWYTKGPGRHMAAAPEHFVPLAAELEGIRGVYLYYGVPGTDSMTAEYRDVVVKDRTSDRVRAIYRELIAGPTQGTSPFPDGTELLNTYETPRGTLYLDWNRTLVTGFRGGTSLEHQILASIVLTAADNLPEVQRVVLLVEGSPVETLGGHYDILAPLDVADWR